MQFHFETAFLKAAPLKLPQLIIPHVAAQRTTHYEPESRETCSFDCCAQITSFAKVISIEKQKKNHWSRVAVTGEFFIVN